MKTLKALFPYLTSLELSVIHDNEKAARIEKEKEILEKMADEVHKIKQEIEKERSERIFKLKELDEEFKEEIERQTKILEEYQKKSIDELASVKSILQDEMETRFTHQDEIIDNLSKFIKTFQDTLKEVSKNV